MNRYRIVTTQDGKEHISSVVLNRDEAFSHIEIERLLLQDTGWNVTTCDDMLIASRLNANKLITRLIQFREFTTLEDHVSQT